VSVRRDYCVRPRGISLAAYWEFHMIAVRPKCRSTTLRPGGRGHSPSARLTDARMGALAVPQIRRYALGPASRRLDIRGDVLFGRADALALPPQTCRPVPK
jgi:hypothetical protein